jgi:hypothetical protein
VDRDDTVEVESERRTFAIITSTATIPRRDLTTGGAL